ncbi:MAG: type II secretion system GspH family protein [gamma proteobacterium symbiont of Bathyaustriella thionipta]|nr:type II secretion system GspH family protein [gamma proteobacterium symbiont of Bathyaustriella thionipta]MCU7950423.1 type II secretion system GspH family protein [gamma proteobacterium symbiont of Bathyaustriella thionipta]MCU7953073.1 type II secretion system GspH family protein [gamma proteobacterium symbiont of Bathyaustriella thionipta]MCU7956929.1 type II secretion system GspH family protein [gamma proteobacterium symbiont of Bathyaustriella thionipta]MCU7965647.1 type II secretion sy
MRVCTDKQHGFTLVELITVIVILGILATVGASKFFNQSSFTDTQYHQEILSAFRYAQKIAIASQNDVTICLSANAYDLYYSSAACAGTRIKHPAGQGDYSDTISATITPTVNYTYNASGEASPNGSFTVGGRNITVEAVTGYVHE